MIDCSSARRTLREAGTPAASSAELAAARRHWRDCDDCRAWEEADRDWRAALRDKISGLRTPAPVKERIFAALAGARVSVDLRRQRRQWLAAVVVLALLGASVGGLWWSHESRRDGYLVAALTEDHLLYATHPAPAEFASADPAAVAEWFASRLDFGVAAPPIQDAELVGGRLCTLADRRVALWLYRKGLTRLSLFQMPAQGLYLGAMRRMQVNGRRYRCGHRKGVSVLAWTERGVLYALVSDLPEEEMLRIVRS